MRSATSHTLTNAWLLGRGASHAPRLVTNSGPIFSKEVTDLSQLAGDDELASKEAAAAGGLPGYCRDRLYKAYAGGQYCPKE